MSAEALPQPAPVGADAAPRGGFAGGVSKITHKPWWPTAKRTLGVVFIVGVLLLMGNLARQFDWPKALAALRALPTATLALAAAMAACSYVLFAAYDLIGRQQTRHGLASWRVVALAATVYAFNLNLGTLIGAIGLRVRLYAQRGLSADAIARVIALSIATNWLGYMLLTGAVLLLAPPDLPDHWSLAPALLRGIGAVLLALVAAYVAACCLAKKREWHWRDYSFVLPSGGVALVQLALSSANWMLIAGISWVLLQQQVPYGAVLIAMLTAAMAGVATHVPAGLGVLEGVFIALLNGRVPQEQLLAALLAYRAVYYLLPLGIAGLALLVMEARAKRGLSGGAAASGST